MGRKLKEENCRVTESAKSYERLALLVPTGEGAILSRGIGLSDTPCAFLSLKGSYIVDALGERPIRFHFLRMPGCFGIGDWYLDPPPNLVLELPKLDFRGGSAPRE